MKEFFLILSVFLLPSLLRAQTDKILVCYWGTWSHYRPNEGTFSFDKIPVNLCTHVIYSFAGLDPITNRIMSTDHWLDYSASDSEQGGLDMIRKTVSLKSQNPNLKISIAVGGWNEGSIKYSNMAADQSSRATFIQSVVEFIEKFDLDGFDLDWEYPANRDGSPDDKTNFPLLLKEFREAFDKVSRPGRDPLLLTSAFGCSEKILDSAYDIEEIDKWIDYYHLMLYDYKMYNKDDPNGKLIGHHSPLYSKPSEDAANQELTNSFSVESFIRRGATPAKLIFGVGAYAKTYELYNSTQHNFYDEAKGPGAASVITSEPGTSALFEICLETRKNPENWEIGLDADYKVPFAFSDTKWMGYDNEWSSKMKVNYAMDKGLGGMMVWSIDFDDFANYCGGWEPFPVVFTLRDEMDYYSGNKK